MILYGESKGSRVRYSKIRIGIVKYTLYKDTIDDYSTLEQLLYNRDIPREEQKHWLNADEQDIHDWRLLNEKEMVRAVSLLNNHVNNHSKIVVLVDCD